MSIFITCPGCGLTYPEAQTVEGKCSSACHLHPHIEPFDADCDTCMDDAWERTFGGE